MPEIRPPYALSELPQTSSTLDLRSAVHCGTSRIYLGISHSSLAAYSLKSTPRLVWTHAISPVTKVLAVEAVAQKDKPEILYFATTNKYGAGSLRRIPIITDDNQEEEVLLEKTETIIDIRASKEGDFLYLLFKNGNVQCLSVNDEGANIEWTSKNSDSSEVLFHDHLASGHIDMPEDGLFVTVLKTSGKNSSIQVRMIALDETNGQELVNSTVNASPNSVYGLHMGSLLLFDPRTFSLLTYSLPNLALLSTIQVRRNQKAPTEKASLLPVGKNRILLSYDNTLKLVDTKYSTILSKRVLDKPIQLANFSQKHSLAVGFTDTEIVSLPVEPGTGSLLESLGKGVISHDSKWDLAHGSFVFDQSLSSEDFIKLQTTTTEQQKEAVTSILKKLFKWFKSGKYEAYENWAIAYLKNEEFAESGVPELISQANGEALIYDASNDREVDASFISTLVGQIFAGKNLTLDQIDPATLKLSDPIDRLAVYLLTHPLFPTPQFPNLLTVLSGNPRLYRQAIVTAPGLSCDQIVSSLQAFDNETFKDAIIRLSDEFNTKPITESIKRVFKATNDAGQEESQVTSIVKCVERMQKLDIGWPLMTCFIDAGGLFAWDEQILDSLQTRVDTEIDNLNFSSQALTALGEALKLVDYQDPLITSKDGVNEPIESLSEVSGKRSEKKKKALERKAAKRIGASKSSAVRDGPELVSATQHSLQRMRAVLSFGQAGMMGMHHTDYQESYARSVPQYTVEKLIL